MSASPRVGVVVDRFTCPGGVQTCFIELVAGLNRVGITPEIAWDEPTDWQAIGSPVLDTTFGGGSLPIGSRTVRSLPAWLQDPAFRFSVRFARLNLERYDFIYCFQAGIRMPASTPNVCWLTGPAYLQLPDPLSTEDDGRARWSLKNCAVRLISPRLHPDPNSRYVAIAEWIADRFLHTYGSRLPVIWPPVRERTRPGSGPGPRRAGFLFLSRLEGYKNPEVMLGLAQRFPDVPVTVAGATIGSSKEPDRIRRLAAELALRNLTVVEDPTDDMIGRLFDSHLVFVFPARWEHFGIVTVEAIQAGLLPLVHDSGGQREIVPIDKLRFKSEKELAEKAAALLATTIADQRETLAVLQRHVARGSPDNYRKEMIMLMCQDLGLTELASRV
ncbi:MAG TPA: glycosyltransferase family 4 protein [bacterium]|nr:glycosyltransferase family 4 protein [bacterium]